MEAVLAKGVTDEELAERGLPESAYFTNKQKRSDDDAPVILVRRGEAGYFPVWTSATADELNDARGVSASQAKAMMHGSMFGWETRGARPSSWPEE